MSATPPPVEVWLPVLGFEGLYDISNLGRVRNCSTRKVLRPGSNRGYAHVALYSEHHGPRTTYIHRAVLEAFCGPAPFPGAEACHNDGMRSNNRLTNLRWGTRRDNTDDRARHGRTRFGTGQRCAKLSEADVRQMRAECRAGKSTRLIARERGISTNTSWCAITGKTWSHIEGAMNDVR